VTRPLLLDLFSGAGGAAVGYHRAGFDVVGVDNRPQPHYPFEFHQGDAMTWPLAGFDAIHASPPCQDWSKLRSATGRTHGTAGLLPATRARLLAQSAPWVIENVPGAAMRADYRLCGCMFGLPGLRRERWFETSWHAFDLRPPCWHTGQAIDVTGHSKQGRTYRDGSPHYGITEKRAAMGIDWMNRGELAQAIPPAYTQHIGEQLLAHLTAGAA
jgi:DNA (cytosine-5)-methyltransferase 1